MKPKGIKAGVKISTFSLEMYENENHLKHRGEAVLRKHLHRRLRTFEENQMSKIIRRTKCKMTLLKFHQFYSAKKYPKEYARESRNPFFPNWKQQKNPSLSTGNI